MRARAGGAPAELEMLREVVEHFRTVLAEWDRFLDWVQAERRALDDLRDRFGALEREHARLRETCDRLGAATELERAAHAELRSAHEGLRKSYERTHEELQALRRSHEGVLREREDTYDLLHATLRRLKD